MKKMLLMAVAFLMTTAMNAQNAEKGFSYAAEAGIGSELELGVRAQYNFNKYFALDLPVLKYARDYGSHPHNEITIQAGVRGFSPTFGPDLKAFAALDMGYGNMFKNGGSSSFAIDFTMGFYVWEGLYVGYGYGGMRHHSDHLVRVGYSFTY